MMGPWKGYLTPPSKLQYFTNLHFPVTKVISPYYSRRRFPRSWFRSRFLLTRNLKYGFILDICRLSRGANLPKNWNRSKNFIAKAAQKVFWSSMSSFKFSEVQGGVEVRSLRRDLQITHPCQIGRINDSQLPRCFNDFLGWLGTFLLRHGCFLISVFLKKKICCKNTCSKPQGFGTPFGCKRFHPSHFKTRFF